MRKTILILAVSAFTTGTVLTSCQSSAKKVENAQENLQDARADVKDAKNDLKETLNDTVLRFKNESKERIMENEKNLAEFKGRIKNEKKEAKIKYEKKLAELEQKNSDMKKKLDDYQVEGSETWTEFKTEFNHDMDELGTAFKDLTVKNTK